jgi:nicotinamidase-related amidase
MISRALICIDLINDMVASSGKLAGKGYAAFMEKHSTAKSVRKLQDRFREEAAPVLHVRVGFDPAYLNHPSESPLFGGAAKLGALAWRTWGTEFFEDVSPLERELVIDKPRVSAFYGTALESALRALGIREVVLAGVATDLAIQAAARDAHDRDFVVQVVEDACIAANEEDHLASLRSLAKLAAVLTVDDLA